MGKHIVEALIERGVSRENIIIPHSKDCDLRIWENCKKATQGVDIAIHTAALTGNPEFHLREPARIFYDNLIMGVQLMEAARQAGVEKFVTIGSVTEYPEGAPQPLKEEDLWIGPPDKTHFPYSVVKRALLVQAQAYRTQYKFRSIHLLMTNMYGPGATEGVIPSLIGRILEAKEEKRGFIEIWGTGKPIRDFLYVDDAAEGIILAAEEYDKPEPVNLGSGREVAIKDLIESVCRLMDYEGEIRRDPSRPEGRPRSLLDISKAKGEFGFGPKTSLEEGLEKTIEWYKNQVIS